MVSKSENVTFHYNFLILIPIYIFGGGRVVVVIAIPFFFFFNTKLGYFDFYYLYLTASQDLFQI